MSFSTSSRSRASCSRVSSRAARELLVLGGGLGELVLGLEEALFEHPDPARGVLEAPPQDGDLLLEHPDRGAELLGFALAVFQLDLPPLAVRPAHT